MKTRASSYCTLTAMAMTLALALTAVAGCNNRAANSPAPQAQSSEETSKDFGDYELHFNAVRTDQLTVDVARSYGIERSKNRVLLNVTVLQKGADGKTRPVEAEVTVAAHNLNGQVKDAALHRITEGDAIYYIGEVSINGSEIIVFDVHAVPAGPGSTGNGRQLDLQFKREFFAD